MMRRKRWFWSVVLLVAFGCGGKDDEKSSTTAADSGLPRIEGVDLSGLGKGSSAAVTEANCASSEIGLFGLALGGACHSAPIADSILTGEAKVPDDGSCTGIDPDAETTGLLLGLTCNPNIPDGTESAVIDSGANELFAISFNDFDDGDAVGVWNTNGRDSYPANIRVWKGASLSSLIGLVAVDMTTTRSGKVYYNFGDFSDSDTIKTLKGKSTFEVPESRDNCATAPSKENCLFQEIEIYAGEDAISNGPPNGFHIAIYADKPENADFIALEGKYRYTQTNAETQFGGANTPSVLTSTRTIYFQFVQNTTEMWGKFFFRDENGTLLSYKPGSVDYFELFSQGFCQKLGAASFDENNTSCSSIDATTYESLWAGEANFANVEADPIASTMFNDPPQTNGVVTK